MHTRQRSDYEYEMYKLSFCEKLIYGDVLPEDLFYRKMLFKKCRTHLCTLFSFAYTDQNLIELFRCVINRTEFAGEIYGFDFEPEGDEVIFYVGYEYEERMLYSELIIYMKRAMRIFRDFCSNVKSNFDIYLML